MILTFFEQAAEVEETLKRIQGHRGVTGTIVVNSEGNEFIIKVHFIKLLGTMKYK